MIGIGWLVIGMLLGYTTYVVAVIIHFHLQDKKRRENNG